jgi:hypothetical protein
MRFEKLNPKEADINKIRLLAARHFLDLRAAKRFLAR